MAESSPVYKTIDLVGTSPDSMEAAIRNAVDRAGETLRGLRWFEVLETRGPIANQRIEEWQVRVRVGFSLDEGQSVA